MLSIRAPDHRISPSRTKQACDLGRYHFAKLVLPLYLLHEPVIMAAAWLIVRRHAPLPGEYAALVIVSFAATLCLCESLVRRFRSTRAPVRHEAHNGLAEAAGSHATATGPDTGTAG